MFGVVDRDKDPVTASDRSHVLSFKFGRARLSYGLVLLTINTARSIIAPIHMDV